MTAVYWHISQGMVDGLVAIRRWNLSADQKLDRPQVPRETQRSLLKRRLIRPDGQITEYGQVVLRFLQQADAYEAVEAPIPPFPGPPLEGGLTDRARAETADRDAIEARADGHDA